MKNYTISVDRKTATFNNGIVYQVRKHGIDTIVPLGMTGREFQRHLTSNKQAIKEVMQILFSSAKVSILSFIPNTMQPIATIQNYVSCYQNNNMCNVSFFRKQIFYLLSLIKFPYKTEINYIQSLSI